jgi:RND family efflux transporter MFP subunit
MSANPSRFGLKLSVVIVVLAAAGAAVWFSLRPVAKVVAVKSDLAQDIVPGAVVVTPEKTSEIRSEAEGRLIESELAPGKVVKEGEKLAQLDAADLDIQIKHTQSEIAAAKAMNEANDRKSALAWQTTEEEFKERERLHQNNVLADVPFAQEKRAFESKQQDLKLAKVANDQKVENLENTLATLQLRKKQTTITAPFDGVVSQVFAHKGDLIASKQALATLITVSRIVTGKISEERFAAIQVGQKALVKFLTYGDETFSAKVAKKLPTAEESTQRYIIYLDVDIPPEKLLPNLTGDLAIVVGEHPRQPLVPRRAIFDGKFVFVVENGRVARREIEVGFTSLTTAEVTKGLQPGELVIVEDRDQFAEGDRVRTDVLKW